MTVTKIAAPARVFTDVYDHTHPTAHLVYVMYRKMVDFNGPIEDLPEREIDSINTKLYWGDKFCLCGVWFYPLSGMWVPCTFTVTRVAIVNRTPRGGTHLECHSYDFAGYAKRFIKRSTSKYPTFKYLGLDYISQPIKVFALADEKHQIKFTTPIIVKAQ